MLYCGYGAVTVSDSVALVAPAGVHAAITAFTGNAITITAGVSDVVVLRGLYLSALGGERGIHFVTGQTLHVESCVVSGFSFQGVFAESPGRTFNIKERSAGKERTDSVHPGGNDSRQPGLDRSERIPAPEHGVFWRHRERSARGAATEMAATLSNGTGVITGKAHSASLLWSGHSPGEPLGRQRMITARHRVATLTGGTPFPSAQ